MRIIDGQFPESEFEARLDFGGRPIDVLGLVDDVALIGVCARRLGGRGRVVDAQVGRVPGVVGVEAHAHGIDLPLAYLFHPEGVQVPL